MSILRVFGIILALAIFAVIFFRLRRHSESRLDVVVLFFFGLTMLLVSLFPSMVNLPTEIFSLDKHERGRLLALLIISSVALWLLLIYERGKTRFLSQGFDRLVRALAVDMFFERNTVNFGAESILVLIPAYNEVDNISAVISGLPAIIHERSVYCIVVDDGSSDGTGEIAAQQGALVARNIINRGGGAALRVGFELALALGVDIIITMDADGQHQPEDMPRLVEPLLDDTAELVIGSRLLGSMERYSRIRYVGVHVFSWLLSVILGKKITDPASGFRAMNSKVLRSCLLVQDQYHTAELIIEAVKNNTRIIEIPVVIKRRLSGKSKKGKNISYALCFFRTIIKTWLR